MSYVIFYFILNKSVDVDLRLSFFYLLDGAEADRKVHVLDLTPVFGRADPRPRHRQVGSLAGAAHLSNDNAGVLR